MIPPKDVKIYDGELAVFWLDESGILCANGKSTPRTLEKQKANFELIKQITNNKKVCILSDATSSGPQDNETRAYTADEMPNLFKAMAVIANSVTSKYIVNLFLALKSQPVPIKMFSSEKEAREWLKNYL
jgi:hypothetical protein